MKRGLGDSCHRLEGSPLYFRGAVMVKKFLMSKFSKVALVDVPKDMPEFFWQAVEEVRKLIEERVSKHVIPMPVRGEMPP